MSGTYSHTQKNAFADRLSAFDFNPHSMLVVDFLHEFELGVWKATFIHIIRILYAAVPGGKLVIDLNARWDEYMLSNHNVLLSPL